MAKNGNPSPESTPVEDERLSDREDYARANEHYGEHEMTTREREQAMEMTDPVRRREIRAKWTESVMPNLPRREGWHPCWVSTTHPSDTPQRRHRYGYQFIKYDDLTQFGWSADVDSVKDGRFAGAVMWRELIAMEATLADWNAYMREFHYDQPREAVEGIFQNLDETGEQARSKGGRVTIEDDMIEMRRRMQRPPPHQFEH